MADKKPAGKKVKAKSNFAFIFASMFLAIVAVMMLPTTIIILVGMIPSVVAYFVDTSRQRTLGPTVLYMNFAGVLPVLLKLWKQTPNMNNATELLMDPFMLLLMLAPAGFGWILFIFIPPLVSGILRKRAEMRMTTLENDQKKLVEEWGPEVMGTQAKLIKPEEAGAAPKSADESFTA